MRKIKSKLILLGAVGLVVFGCLQLLKENMKAYKMIDLLDEDSPIARDYQEYKSKRSPGENILLLARKRDGKSMSIDEIGQLHQKLLAAYPTLHILSLKNAKTLHADDYGAGLKPLRELPKDGLNSYFKTNSGAVLYLNSQNEDVLIDLIEKASGLFPDFSFFYFGNLYYQYIFKRESVEEQKLILPALLAVFCLSFFLLFGSAPVILASLFAVGLSYLLTLTFISVWEGTVTPFANFSLYMVFILCVGDLVHYFHDKDNEGKRVFWPCLFTTLTTLAGVGSLALSEVAPIRNFGIYASFGAITSFLLTFYALPFAQKIFDFRFIPKKTPAFYNIPSKSAVVLSWIAFGTLVAGGGYTLFKLEFSENYLKQFPARHKISKDIREVGEELGYTGQVDLVVKSDFSQSLSPDFLKKARSFRKDLLSHPNIAKTGSYLDLADKFDPASEDFRDNMELLDNPKIFGGLISREAGGEQVWKVFFKSMNSKKLSSSFEHIKEAAAKSFGPGNSALAGYGLVRAKISDLLFSTFAGALLSAFAGIFLCFLALFRSLKLALIGLAPNIVPLAAVSAAAYFWTGTFNPYLVALSCVVLGVSVDDTIHLIYAWKRGGDANRAVKKVYAPLLLTSLILIACFSTFALSAFQSLKEAVVYTSLAFICAFWADMYLLPGLLSKMESPKESD